MILLLKLIFNKNNHVTINIKYICWFMGTDYVYFALNFGFLILFFLRIKYLEFSTDLFLIWLMFDVTR